MVTKDQLRKGSKVRVSATWVEGQQERDRSMNRVLGIAESEVHPRNRYDASTVFEVCDLFERKGYTKPDAVGIKVPGSGLAYGIRLVDLVEVVA